MGIYGSNYGYGESPLYKDEGYFPASGEYFAFLPNWKYDITIDYDFKTVVNTNRRGKEQRKPLMLNVLRNESFTVTEKDCGPKIWNFLISKRVQKTFIPIFTEPMRVSGSGSLIGQTTINFTNDSTYYYNLRELTDNIALLNINDYETAELISLDSVNKNSIVLTDAVTVGLEAESTIMFPAMECYLDTLDRNDVTDRVTELSCSFQEYLNATED